MIRTMILPQVHLVCPRAQAAPPSLIEVDISQEEALHPAAPLSTTLVAEYYVPFCQLSSLVVD